MSIGLLDKPLLGACEIALRPYQMDAVDAVRNEFKKGVQSTLLVMATGGGKTPTFGMITRRCIEKGGRVLILAHTEELIGQAVNKLDMMGIECGVEKAEQYARSLFDPDCVIASVQTLKPKRLSTWEPDYFSMVIVDECFPAGTLVNGNPIESLAVGDQVSCVSHSIHGDTIERRPVLRLFKNRCSNLVRVHLSDGTSLVTTKDHPIFVDGIGYVSAAQLRPDFNVVRRTVSDGHQAEGLRGLRDDLSAKELESNHGPDVQSRVQEEASGRSRQESRIAVHGLRNSDNMLGEDGLGISEKRKGLLLGTVQSGSHPEKVFGDDGQDEFGVRLRSHDSQQSNEESAVQSQDDRDSQENRPQAFDSRRQWEGSDDSPDSFSQRTGNFGQRLHSEDRVYDFGRNGISAALQTGPGIPGTQARDRDRRTVSWLSREASAGSQERGSLEIVGVDRVEILEPGSDGTFGGVCPDGYVYNIEVERNHNYFANGILVHNCHHATANSYKRILNYFKSARILGVTATADRADEENLGQVFETVAYEMNLWQLMTAPDPGPYLCQLRFVQCDVDIDLRNLKAQDGDFSDADLEERIGPMVEVLANAIRQESGDRKTLIFTPQVKSAQAMATALQSIGIRAEWISGDDRDRKRKIQEFRDGKLQMLANCSVLLEGFDVPDVGAIALCRPTQSRPLFSQIVGRGTRLFPGKEDCVIIDFNYLTTKHNLVKAVDLIDGSHSDGEVLDIAQELLLKDKTLNLAQAVERAEVEHEERSVLRIKAREREVKYRKVSYNPLDVADTLGLPWRGGKSPDAIVHKATAGQSRALTNMGIEGADQMSRARAGTLLDYLGSRRKQGLATHKQVAWMIKHDVPAQEARSMTKDAATARLSQIWGRN